jgi:hypothetical protein
VRRKAIPARLDRIVRINAGNRCGYCLSPQHLIMARLEIEHIIPLARGGTDAEENLWLACPPCNGHKSDKITARDPESGSEVALFNPRAQDWWDHFSWADDGVRVVGQSAPGRATILALHLNDAPVLLVRSYWVIAGWHPPQKNDGFTI